MSRHERSALLNCDTVELRAGYRTLVRNLKLELYPSESVAIVGPNGFGKTTLLRTLCGVSRPYRGHVFLNGEMVWPEKSRNLKMDLCFLASQPALFLDHSVMSNLQFYLRSLGRDVQIEDISKALAAVNLADHANQTSRTLSTGQKRRLTLAFLRLAKPALVFLDEPTNGLDSQGVSVCLEVLELARTSGSALLIATHDRDLMEWCQRRIDLKELAP